MTRAQTRRERRDASSLRVVSEKRAQAKPDAPRGSVYVVAGERFEVWRVTRRVVVLRSLSRPCAFLTSEVSGWFEAAGWV